MANYNSIPVIYIIDIKDDSLFSIITDNKQLLKKYETRLDAQNKLEQLIARDMPGNQKEIITEFCNLGTIRDRMHTLNSIASNYTGKKHNRYCFCFYVLKRDDDFEPEKLIFTIQILGDENHEPDHQSRKISINDENIIGIQHDVIDELADIIENRDNITGGHIKRMSDVTRIIVNEIKQTGSLEISDDFADKIVTASTIHDLGKIFISSSILCKPGKLTDKEYTVMKTHAAKSGEMVELLLDDIEAEHFVVTAFNIARYHHERWDGTGYPDGLKGEEIPVEARVMAIADVYDALVSERCYKKPMNHDQAYNIIMEGMGTQFDPGMQDAFCGCHKKLEEYYRKTVNEIGREEQS